MMTKDWLTKNILFKLYSFLEVLATILHAIPIPISAYRDMDNETNHILGEWMNA
jgi:hypothetical protein